MALDFDPDNSIYLLDVGRTFYMMGEQENAIGFLTLSIQKGISGGSRALAFNFIGNILQTKQSY